MKTNGNDKALEAYKIFPDVACTLTFGFAFFLCNITMELKDIANNPGDYAVVRSINEIGHYMGKKTIAEDVEDQEVLDRLKEIGVDYAQGYQIAKPLPLEDLRI